MANTSPIPILFHSNYSSLTRGGQKSLWYLLRDIDRRKYFPVLTCLEEGELTARARTLGIPVAIARLPRLRPWYCMGIARYLLELYRLLRRHRIRIFHSEELVTVLLAGLLKPFTGAAVLWHVRVFYDTPLHKRISLLFADRVIAVSHAIADSFPASSKVIVVHNGIDTDEYVPGSARLCSPRFKDNDLLIGYFASLETHKGPHLLLQAAPAVIRKHPAVKFLFVGADLSGDSARLLSLVNELGISSNVIFWGREEQQTKALMERVDLYVLPSFTEGFSRSLLEAMALKKAIVASDIPQNAEMLRHGIDGLLARTGDPADLAEKIITLLDNRALALKMGESARQHVVDRFTLRMTSEGLSNIYDRLFAAEEY